MKLVDRVGDAVAIPSALALTIVRAEVLKFNTTKIIKSVFKKWRRRI